MTYTYGSLVEIKHSFTESTISNYLDLEFDFMDRSSPQKESKGRVELCPLASHTFRGIQRVYALGKGIFYCEELDAILLSRDGGTAFYDENTIYALIENYSGHDPLRIAIDFSKQSRNSWATTRLIQLKRRLLNGDPRSIARASSESFVSQFVEPALYEIFAKSEMILVHAAGLVKDEKCILLCGPQNVGKTSATLALCQRGWHLLGDDFVLLSPDGTVHAYNKPLKLEQELLNNRPEWLARAQAYSEKDPALMRMGARKRGGRARSNFEVKVPASALGLSTASEAMLTDVFFLQRGVNISTGRSNLDQKRATALLVQHQRVEFDGNKRLFREINNQLSLHRMASHPISLITSSAEQHLSTILEGATSHILTLSNPYDDVVKMIEDSIA